MLADGLSMMYGLDRPPQRTTGQFGHAQLNPLFAELSGASFGGGLYRVHTPEAAAVWTENVEAMFPELAGRVLCFGYDWLGRHFALDRDRRDGRRHLVLLLEPGTGEAMEVPATVASLHEEELVNNGEAALALDFYADWRESSGDEDYLGPDECVGYGVPLFFGGDDEVANLARIDMGRYWSALAQLREGTVRLRRGSTVHQLVEQW